MKSADMSAAMRDAVSYDNGAVKRETEREIRKQVMRCVVCGDAVMDGRLRGGRMDGGSEREMCALAVKRFEFCFHRFCVDLIRAVPHPPEPSSEGVVYLM